MRGEGAVRSIGPPVLTTGAGFKAAAAAATAAAAAEAAAEAAAGAPSGCSGPMSNAAAGRCCVSVSLSVCPSSSTKFCLFAPWNVNIVSEVADGTAGGDSDSQVEDMAVAADDGTDGSGRVDDWIWAKSEKRSNLRSEATAHHHVTHSLRRCPRSRSRWLEPVRLGATWPGRLAESVSRVALAAARGPRLRPLGEAMPTERRAVLQLTVPQARPPHALSGTAASSTAAMCSGLSKGESPWRYKKVSALTGRGRCREEEEVWGARVLCATAREEDALAMRDGGSRGRHAAWERERPQHERRGSGRKALSPRARPANITASSGGTAG